RRRAIVGYGSHCQAGGPTGGYSRFGGGCRCEHERGGRAVQHAETAQTTHYLRNMSTEDPPIVVTLVDHDVAEGAEELRPAPVGGQHRAMQHVRVSQHDVSVVTSPVALFPGAVTIDGSDASTLQAHGEQPAELIVG